TLESGAQDPSLRARAHSLNNQAISQLRRLQNLGTEVQRFVRQERVQPGPPDYGAEKHPPPFVDFASDVFSTYGVSEAAMITRGVIEPICLL
ncbi:unnamed protein product, partial [Dicrocoelium dendriticum]